MAAILEAYVTNLGKYNEGALVYEKLKFPTTTEAVQDLLKRIGVDGIRYGEILITGYESSVAGLPARLGEYESIDELNHLACLLAELTGDELKVFEAVLSKGEYTSCIEDLINLSQNLDCYVFYHDVTDDEELGRMHVLELGSVGVPEHLIDYIDYEAYGRDVRINEGGHYTPDGYVMNNRGPFVEVYAGIDDIPAEHKVFSFPRLGIREQMAAYKEAIGKAAAQTERPAPAAGREDR